MAQCHQVSGYAVACILSTPDFNMGHHKHICCKAKGLSEGEMKAEKQGGKGMGVKADSICAHVYTLDKVSLQR